MRDRVERREQHALQQQVIGIRQRAARGIEDVGVEDGAVHQRRGIREDRLHPPAENPQIEIGIARTRRRAEQRSWMQHERPRRHHRRGEVDTERPQPTHDQLWSSRLRSSFASLGLALPPLPFITWPTRKPKVFCCPARYCAAASALLAMTSRMIATSASSSLFCASPSAATMSSADRPLSYIFAKTSLAIALLIVPFSTSAIRPASASGRRGTCATSRPRSFIVRSSSPITQLLAAFALPLAA